MSDLLVDNNMEIICFMCNGSGWKKKYPTGMKATMEIFILIPCGECQGKGFISTVEPKEKKDDQTS
jgi:DnaJ-class molecular chaperone